MALKAIIFLLASFLLVATRVSSNDEEAFKEAAYAIPPVKAPAPTPVLAPAPAPILPPVMITECPRLCGDRCGLHSRQRRCKRVCLTCCVRCKCVPPGTYGNREMCGKCYINMTTHGNIPKCP
ncbi:hypothetical protein HHK36_024878 [Tetracentron sinense]|uniref:Uncharacterized protein n=1 Tax=Tetracentron sinense TaxID=13715 RepID=A0A834YPV2_TETSI|nr:hypothetical protein HHK36_024878 [Tetracentron sinense]